jgi:hypothetical protein
MQLRSVSLQDPRRAYGKADDPVKSPHASPIPAPKPSSEQDVFGSSPLPDTSMETGERRVLRWTGKAAVSFIKWSLWVFPFAISSAILMAAGRSCPSSDTKARRPLRPTGLTTRSSRCGSGSLPSFASPFSGEACPQPTSTFQTDALAHTPPLLRFSATSSRFDTLSSPLSSISSPPSSSPTSQ